MKYTIDNDLFKSGSHRYVKRTGAPGAYKYWYKMPNGTLAPHDDAEAASAGHSAAHGKREHVRRLIAGRLKGHHAMTNDQIASEVGVEKHKINENITNMRSAGRRKVGEAIPEGNDHANHGHDFEEHHLHEAHTATNHPDYDRHAEGHSAASSGGEAPASPARRSRRRPPRAGTHPAEEMTDSDREGTREAAELARRAAPASRRSSRETHREEMTDSDREGAREAAALSAADRTRARRISPATADREASQARAHEEGLRAQLDQARQNLADHSARSGGPTPEALAAARARLGTGRTTEQAADTARTAAANVASRRVGKSFSLVVDMDMGPVRFKKSFVTTPQSDIVSDRAAYLRKLIDEKSRD